MTIRSYRTRQARVQAMPFTTLTKYDALDWIRTNGGKATEGSSEKAGPVLVLQTAEGNQPVCLGDWIIRDANGVFSRCEPHEFVPRYDEADRAMPADRAALFDEAADAIKDNVLCQSRAEMNAKQNCVDLLRRLASAEPRTAVAAVLAEVQAERDRQDARWGEQNHPDGTGPDIDFLGTPLDIHVAAFRRSCQDAAAAGKPTWFGISLEEDFEAYAERDPAMLRAELIQSIAVKVAWVQAIDRRTSGGLSAGAAGDGKQAAHAERRDRVAGLIYEYWNPGESWAEEPTDGRVAFEADADIAMRAADIVDHRRYAPPTHADIYLEVAARLDLYVQLQRARAAGVTALPDVVRRWAEELPSEAGRAAAGETRPRCPHCQLPHDLTPGSPPAVLCAQVRQRITDAERLHREGDHHLCCRADCDVLQHRNTEDPEAQL
jgi:hypothetical protein